MVKGFTLPWVSEDRATTGPWSGRWTGSPRSRRGRCRGYTYPDTRANDPCAARRGDTMPGIQNRRYWRYTIRNKKRNRSQVRVLLRHSRYGKYSGGKMSPSSISTFLVGWGVQILCLLDLYLTVPPRPPDRTGSSCLCPDSRRVSPRTGRGCQDTRVPFTVPP